jgi:hypothetical protein
VTLPSNVPRGKEDTQALPKIFRWQKDGLEGFPILFLVAKKKTTPPRYATDFPQKNVQSAVKNLLLLIFLHGLLFCSPELFIY